MELSRVTSFLQERVKDLELFKPFIYQENTKHNSTGGVLWFRYSSLEEMKPSWLYFDKDSDGWRDLKNMVDNFDILENGYNPYIHVLIYVSVKADKEYGQLLRIKYGHGG